MQSMLDELVLLEIDVVTLNHGTADWHYGRKFLITSSQSNASFEIAFINYQNDSNWCNVAEYLFGKNYHKGKGWF